jgi:hypothetical protein
LRFLRIKPYETAFFKVAVPKSDILELAHILYHKERGKKPERLRVQRHPCRRFGRRVAVAFVHIALILLGICRSKPLKALALLMLDILLEI